MFLLNTHRETNCSHNPTGPPREIEVFIPFAPEAVSTARHWLLHTVMGDQILAFCSARTCCIFHSIEPISCSRAHRKWWHLQWEWNSCFCSSLLLMRRDLTRLISDFRLCREPPQPTLGTGMGTVPCSPPSTPRSTRPVSSGMGITR